jgi:hypothetical protein
MERGWRQEVKERGKFWNWRERGRKGKGRYGGKFHLLDEARQKAYEVNKRKYHAQRRKAKGAAGTVARAGTARRI